MCVCFFWTRSRPRPFGGGEVSAGKVLVVMWGEAERTMINNNCANIQDGPGSCVSHGSVLSNVPPLSRDMFVSWFSETITIWTTNGNFARPFNMALSSMGWYTSFFSCFFWEGTSKLIDFWHMFYLQHNVECFHCIKFEQVTRCELSTFEIGDLWQGGAKATQLASSEHVQLPGSIGQGKHLHHCAIAVEWQGQRNTEHFSNKQKRNEL